MADRRSQLDDYRRKRDFARTAEPQGGAAPSSASGRLYLVQKHAARQLHYDLRLELDGVLKSWAVPRGPSLDPSDKPLAVEVEDHPIEYGAFEGVIPEGEYGGGTVMLWDRGEWEPIGDAHEGYGRGDLKFRLHGQKLRGEWVLARMGGKAGEGGRNWLLIKKRDGEARPLGEFNVLAELPLSVASGRTMDEIAEDPGAVWTDGGEQLTESGRRERTRKPRAAAGSGGAAARHIPDVATLPGARPARQPQKLAPQLATLAAAPPEGDDWLHEIKLDGYRFICAIQDGRAILYTRNGHDWTDRLPAVAQAAARLPVESAILDGEVVVFDGAGKSDFQALQNAFRGERPAEFVYQVFDVPFASGYDLRKVPLIERKRYLEALLKAAPLAAPRLQYCDHIVGRGPIVYEQAARAGLEGILSKRVASPYESRRTESWLKVKCLRSDEFVVGGFTPPSGSRSGFGALLLGQHDEVGRLIYCGRVGTGFDERTLGELAAILEARVTDTPPFANPKADPDHRLVKWVEPELVVEVHFTSWTDDHLVRHASYHRLRDDKGSRDVVRQPEAREAAPAAKVIVSKAASPDDALVAGVRISNPRRTVYPEDGVSKRDVAEYYAAVAGSILPHVAGRPLSLVRCPLGLAGEAFYQREIGEGFPGSVRGIEIEGDHAMVVDDPGGLLSLVQMGVLEIHAWGCRADDPKRPDRLVFDLDPGPGIEWAHVVESARFLHDYLGRLKLASFVKTSGGKGLHVVVPIVRRCGWEEAKAFTRAVATDIVRIAPRNFVATMSKALRENRIFIDYLRNQMGSTSIAAYSTRARNGAPVSTPLSWEELSPDLKPRDLNVRTVPPRLAGPDPWDGFFDLRQSITASMRKQLGM